MGIEAFETNPEIIDVLSRIEQHLAIICGERSMLPSEWLTVEEAAKQIKLSRDTIERLIGSGQLKAASIDTTKGKGGRSKYRIRREWLDDFMQSRIRPACVRHDSSRRSGRRRRAVRDFIG